LNDEDSTTNSDLIISVKVDEYIDSETEGNNSDEGNGSHDNEEEAE
jgi:hypothetical protein